MENDLLVSSATAEIANAHELKHYARMCEEISQPDDVPSAPEKTRFPTKNTNLRKSIAWDKAFFTSEGVLDNEELDNFRSVASTNVACTLPSIQEAVPGAAQSSSSLKIERHKLEFTLHPEEDNKAFNKSHSVIGTSPKNQALGNEELSSIDNVSYQDNHGSICKGSKSTNAEIKIVNEDFPAQRLPPKPMKMRNESLKAAHASPEKNTSNKYGMRKSIAWDNAFFTSEGVLNDEELAFVSGAFSGCVAARGASLVSQEDMRGSAESCSTFDSESSHQENLEVNLFDNVHASIQKTSGKSNKASKDVHSRMAAKLRNPNTTHGSISIRAEICPKDMIPKLSASRRNAPNKKMQPLVGSKSPLSPLQAGSRPAVCKDLASLPKPPRIASRGGAPTPAAAAAGEKNTISRSSQAPTHIRKSPTVPAALKRNQGTLPVPPTNISPSSLRSSRDNSLRGSIDSTKKMIRRAPPSLSMKKPMGGSNTGVPFDSHTGSSSLKDSVELEKADGDTRVLPDVGGKSRLSGLRLPTPKIGYFDKNKSLVSGLVSGGARADMVNVVHPPCSSRSASRPSVVASAVDGWRP